MRVPEAPGIKPPPNQAAAPRSDLVAWADEGARPISLCEVTQWRGERQRLLFQVLLPIDILVRFGVDPVALTDAQGRRIVRTVVNASGLGVRIELYHSGDAQDPMVELELTDTPFNQIEVVWLVIQDPRAPRFDIDRTADGEPTLRGTARRNLVAEQMALAHGLAPGQVRQGLAEFENAVARMDTFMLCLNQHEYIAQPLYYHTAVLFERAGFTYLQGQARMERINAGFAPGGDLRQHLDSSSPFRRPELADSVRGRAWAIHDGILGESWDRVRMVKRLGVHGQVDTCPGIPW